MPGNNLTRDEAYARSALLRVHGYAVALDLTTGEHTFRSTTTIRFTCHEPGTEVQVDLVAPVVHAVSLNGRTLDPTEVADGFRIVVPGLAVDNELTVVADCAYSHTGEGLHRFTDPVDGSVYLYTQFEPADARRVFATFEQPDLKAPVALTVTAPADWQVVGNAATPEPRRLPDRADCAVWRFAPTEIIPTYLVALVAGPYHAVRDVYRRGDLEIPLGVFCRRSLAEYLDADEILTVTRQGLDYYHEVFGVPYPWGKYDQAFVPEYNIGAMENPGCVTFREDFVHRSRVTDAAYERRANVILHEMAHMWFGDLVTPEWWDDLWLKESFADFMGSLAQAEATRWTDAWTTFANQRKAWAYRQDQWSTTHPIVADVRDLDDAKLNFDGITYAKGAAVLKQLMAYVGREAFFAGARTYFRRHAFGNTRLRDLLDALEESCGRDLSAWSCAWLETAGVTTLRPEVRVDEAGAVRSLTVVQEPPLVPPDVSTNRPHRLAVGLYRRGAKGIVRTHRVELDVAGARTEVPALVGAERPDLVLVNDDDLTYAKARLDPTSWETVREGLGEIAETLPRALVWTSVWNMVRDGLLPAREFLRLAGTAGGEETHVGVLQNVHQQALFAIEVFLDPVGAEPELRTLAERARAHTLAAEPGSDRQLTWLRFFAQVASDPADLSWLRDLQEGRAVLPGITLDQDLRWALWEALVSRGAADEADIDAESHRDPTASGLRQALRCRAARPTPQAKEDAWRSVVESDDLPNAAVDAVLAGFRQGHQRELLAPFTERYFAAIADVWRTRSVEMAVRIVTRLYPSLQVNEDTLLRTETWLASAPDVPALRRLVVEARDELTTALRARRRDAEDDSPRQPQRRERPGSRGR